MSLLSLEAISSNCTSGTLNTLALSAVRVVLLGQIFKAIYSVVSRLPLDGFFWNFVSGTLNTLATSGVKSVGIGQQPMALNLHSNVSFRIISFSVGGIFLKPRIRLFRDISYKRHKFGCDQSITKRTLLTQHCYFLALSRLPLDGFPWNFVCGTSQASYFIQPWNLVCNVKERTQAVVWEQGGEEDILGLRRWQLQ